MTEKLSGFVIDTPEHISEGARQEKINSFLDQMEDLLATRHKTMADLKEDEALRNDPEILALSRRLEEWTTPGATTETRAVENLINSSKSRDVLSSADNFDQLVDQALKEVVSPETPDAGEQISEATRYIKERQKKIVDLRRELVMNIVPKIAGEVKKIINDQIHQWDMDYNEFQQEVDAYKHREDLAKVRAEFGMFFNNWYSRLSLIYQEASKNLDKQ